MVEVLYFVCQQNSVIRIICDKVKSFKENLNEILMLPRLRRLENELFQVIEKKCLHEKGISLEIH